MSISLMDGFVKDLKVHVSHFGYHPEHPKRVICTGLEEETDFQIVDALAETVVWIGKLAATLDDFGKLLVGDFTRFSTPGSYYVRVGKDRSFGTFRIQSNLWDDYQRMIALHHFGIRRIGEDNVVGNMGDFHGVRWNDAMLSNGEGWRYIGASFADGDDRRIYPSVSLIVAQYCALGRTRPFWDSGDWIYSQVRWGLDGALSFLDKDGILRKALHAFPDADMDGQFYTGNEKRLGDAFDQTVTCNEYGLENREVVLASLLLGPAEAVFNYYDRDPVFFARVKQLCEIGYEKIEKMFKPFGESGFKLKGEDFRPFAGKFTSAAWTWLSALMHRITGQTRYLDQAIAYADVLMELQQNQPLGDENVQVSGWYRKQSATPSNPWGEKPEQEVMITPWIFQCLFKLLEFYPDHDRAPAWKKSIAAYAGNYLLASSRLNAFGHTPMKVGTEGLKRNRGTLSYQYFASVGRMFHQIGNAAYLIQAGKLSGDQNLSDAGWQQIQWYAGANPLGIGCIYGLSDNIPGAQYHGETFGRCVVGGTKNGMTGDANDQPEVRFWEYYTYGNLNCLWFATAIGSQTFSSELELWPKATREASHEPTSVGHPRYEFPVRLKGGFTYRFAAIQSTAGRVRWYVNAIEGGSTDVGLISPDGAYAAPFVTELQTVTIRVERENDPSTYDETLIALMPAPTKVANVTCRRTDNGVLLSWNPLPENCSGYTLWRRLPASSAEIGTIFERAWAVGPDVTETLYQLNAPAGTEFVIKAYHRSSDMIYGYGAASDPVTLN